MPAHKSAVKRIKQSARNHEKNVQTKSALKTLRKDFIALLASKKDEALKSIPALQSAVDKAAKRGVIHAKKAARLKANLMHRVHAVTAAKV